MTKCVIGALDKLFILTKLSLEIGMQSEPKQLSYFLDLFPSSI